jgi:hypothetical protein
MAIEERQNSAVANGQEGKGVVFVQGFAEAPLIEAPFPQTVEIFFGKKAETGNKRKTRGV